MNSGVEGSQTCGASKLLAISPTSTHCKNTGAELTFFQYCLNLPCYLLSIMKT
jgi:hypothetical protein